jgi:hypothetical protein
MEESSIFNQTSEINNPNKEFLFMMDFGGGSNTLSYVKRNDMVKLFEGKYNQPTAIYNIIAPHVNYPEVILEGYRNDGQKTNIKTQIINAVKNLKSNSSDPIEVYIFQTGVQRELLQLGCEREKDTLMTKITNIWE